MPPVHYAISLGCASVDRRFLGIHQAGARQSIVSIVDSASSSPSPKPDKRTDADDLVVRCEPVGDARSSRAHRILSWNDIPAVRGHGSIYIPAGVPSSPPLTRARRICASYCALLAWQRGAGRPAAATEAGQKFSMGPREGVVDGDVACSPKPSALLSRAQILALQLPSCPT